MTRIQTLIIGGLTTIVAVVFLGLAVAVLYIPIETLPIIIVTPTRTPTTTPTITLTPTLPNFLPTASFTVSATPEPTAVNTRIPTSTPKPENTATSTIIFEVPTLRIIPSATSINTPRPRSTLPQRQEQPRRPTPRRPTGYQITFEADQPTLVEGDCTDIVWFVEGSNSVLLDGSPIAASGRKKVCPRKDTTYQLSVSLPNSTAFEIREIKIIIVDEDTTEFSFDDFEDDS